MLIKSSNPSHSVILLTRRQESVSPLLNIYYSIGTPSKLEGDNGLLRRKSQDRDVCPSFFSGMGACTFFAKTLALDIEDLLLSWLLSSLSSEKKSSHSILAFRLHVFASFCRFIFSRMTEGNSPSW